MGFIIAASLFLLRFVIVFICICILQGGFGLSLLPACLISFIIILLLPGVWGKKRTPPA